MGFFSGKTEVITPEAPAPSGAETGAFRGATTAFTGAGGDIDRQRALEQEQLGIQRGFLPLATNLQQTIMQRLLDTFSEKGLKAQAGLVGQAFQEPFRQAEEDLIAQFQNQGFNPFGTTSGAQALGRFGATKASAIGQALLQNLQFSSQLGIQPVQPFVPQPVGQPFPSIAAGLNLGQAQAQFGGTLGRIRAATFNPEILSQGPKAPGVFGAGGAVIGGIAGGILSGGNPLGVGIGASLGGIGGSALGSSLSRG